MRYLNSFWQDEDLQPFTPGAWQAPEVEDVQS
jgi:hypothetical protein